MKQLLIVLCMLLGILLPYGQVLTPTIRYSVMLLLFWAFLDMELNWQVLKWRHLLVLAAIIVFAFGCWAALAGLDRELALIGFLTAICPTAAMAPAITGFLRGKVAFTTFAVLLNSCALALLIPLALTALLPQAAAVATTEVLIPVLLLVFLPLAVALLFRHFVPAGTRFLLQHKHWALYFFLLNVYIATSKASHYIRFESHIPPGRILLIAAVSLVVCAGSFLIGHYLGGKGLRLESSMVMGRKNTMFGIWLALTFVNPVAAMGPMFYIIFHNAYISWQLYRLPPLPLPQR
ncbi:MAG: hypothetical protein D6730_22780 [Bacteroidetes bacterium]|nr:MAG: hypothetical protein D6730_22780 [Bacteroidota bacterium]